MRFAVHPHIRGDDGSSVMKNNTYGGLPPHTWGYCYFAIKATNAMRFTHTCVGTVTTRAVPD